MKIKIINGFRNAQLADGLVVAIDVFRAFSTACYLFSLGVNSIIAVSDVDIAFRKKRENPDIILIGERQGIKIEGFDYGNSPSALAGCDLKNKTVVFTTTTGVQGIVGAVNANEVVTGSFVNVKSICDYIKKRSPDKITLLCCNDKEPDIIDEDEYCAKYIKSILTDSRMDFHEVVRGITAGVGKRFFLADCQDWFPKADFYLCLKRDKFNFVITTKRIDKTTVLLEKSNLFFS